MAPIQIVVVEDERIVAEDIQDALLGLGYEVPAVASTGQQAIDQVAQIQPDLVLMDIRLQGHMDGIEAARQIRAQFRTPVVYLTAYADDPTLARAKTSEPCGYLHKPFATRELHSTIQMALHKHLGEERLREHQEYLATTLRSIGDAVITTDRRGTVTFLNPVAERITGWRELDAVGRHLGDVFRIVNEDSRQPVENPVATALLKGVVAGLPPRTLLIARDGTEKPIDDSAAPIKDEAGNVTGAVLVFRDMTEFRRMEERLRAAEKLETIGRLAGGIAHHFNNLMAVVLTSADLMLNHTLSEAETRTQLETLREAGARAAALTHQLLTFSRKQRLELCQLNLNQMLADMDKLVRCLLGAPIELITQLDPLLPAVKADPMHLQQVFLNLVANARDAMPQGGRLLVTTANVKLDETAAQTLHGIPPGRYVQLTVQDTGQGMDEATRRRLFEPFFTTKEVDRRTGLGLATAYGIIKQSGGHIEVASVPGQGTTFTIFLPVSEDAKAPQPSTSFTPLPRGCEMLLLVEDEDPLRIQAARVLRQEGFTVLQARNGDEALAFCAHDALPIQLLITDMMMPKLGGAALVQRLHSHRPNLKVLYISGVASQLPPEKDLGPGCAVLQKPFTSDCLVRKVREMLDSTSAAPHR